MLNSCVVDREVSADLENRTADRQAAIRSAQVSAYWGPIPRWIGWSGEEARFRQMRDRAYEYCFRGNAVESACAHEQDDALHSVVLTLSLVEAQRRSPDKRELSDTERSIAEDPQIVARARSYCWSLYDSHGGSDARLLDVCLSDLIDGSRFVPASAPQRDCRRGDAVRFQPISDALAGCLLSTHCGH